MRLPIIAYGDPVLRKKAFDITADYLELDQIIENMFDTMHGANGIGLAAPQIGLPIRLFIIDASSYDENDVQLKDLKKVFINATILEESGEKWDFNEGCLSIPDIREDISRNQNLTISYYNQKWEHLKETYNGLAARIIQHEYDHIEGKLFIDKLSPLRKTLLKKRLDAITKGQIKVDYKMKFPVLKKKR
ncbi:MAG TPA: peptide deformylase [Sphingobacteriaceae bacterium]|nr:peptide deformylase [Sphingobacteriaceae bacterium]